jgi:hypothetical protein
VILRHHRYQVMNKIIYLNHQHQELQDNLKARLSHKIKYSSIYREQLNHLIVALFVNLKVG